MNDAGWSVAVRPYAVLWLIVVAAVALLAWYSYRSTIPPTSTLQRRMLLALRLLGLAFIAVALVGPRLDWHGVRLREQRVTVLVDQSRSMSFVDRHGDRAKALQRVLSGRGMRRLQDSAVVVWQGFDTRTRALDPSSIALTGDATAIGDALLEQRRNVPPPDVVVLLSDGANTAGPDPVRAAREVGLPVYSVGIGDPRRQSDLRIAGVAAPQIGLAGRPMTITATVENIGLPTRQNGLSLRVIASGQTLAERRVTLPPAGRRADFELVVRPTTPGVLHAAVVADSIPGEILTENNTWPFTARILKAERRVVLVAGSPSADVSYWMRFFRERKDFAVSLWLAPHRLRRSESLSADSLSSADLLIWHDVPPNALSRQHLVAVLDAVRKGAGLLVVPGRHGFPDLWEPILPVRAGRVHLMSPGTQSSWTPDAARHPLIAGDPDYAVWSGSWDELPPLLARTVGVTVAESGSELLTDRSGPLAVAGTAGRGRVLVFAGLTYWRWDMIPRGLGQGEPPGNDFWNAAVLWLATRHELSRVRLQTDAPLYRLGEPVRMVVQVYDEHYAPLDGADVRIQIDEGAYGARAASQGEGRHVAKIAGLGPGEHRAIAYAALGDVDLGSGATEFSVAVVGLEHEQTQQGRDALEAIARAGDGAYASVDAADSLLSRISLEPVAEERERSIALGSSGWVLWTIVGLLTVEWIARRVRGLL